MPRRYIDEYTKRVMVRMKASPRFRTQDIMAATGASRATVYRVSKLFRDTHDVVQRNTVRGRPRSLNTFHVNYLESLIERTPDLYLWELRNLFCNAFNCDVDARTIRNELRRHGFTRKKVTRPAIEANDEARTQYKLRITTRY
ncbi:hypothetical protein GGG16DRAFT_119817 [Schizophyllum commune]